MSDIRKGQPITLQHSRLLIGEGREEVLFFRSLHLHLGLPELQIEDYGGKDNLGKYLKALRNLPDLARLQKLAIVRDADDDPAAAKASVESAVKQAAFPAELDVKVLILPGGEAKGALENLCLATIKGQGIETCVEQYLECAAKATGRKHASTSNIAKARIHVWLAAQERPDLRLGNAAEKGYLPWDSPVFDTVRAFLRELA